MEKRSLKLMVVGLAIALTVTLAASPALALSLTGNYFIISPTNPDTSTNPAEIDNATITGLVKASLGAGGLPVYSGTPAPNSGPIQDVDGAGQIQWWTVHSTVAADSVPVRVDSFTGGTLGGGTFGSAFYPTGAGSDANGYRSVHWTGVFHVATTAHLTLSADDDAFLFLNGGLALDNGGVKAIGLATTSSTDIGPGDYVVDLFFADRHVTQSGIAFACDGCLDPVPEPTTLVLFGTTLAGVGAIVRRRLKGQRTPEA